MTHSKIFKKGDEVVMSDCHEARYYAGKVWTCASDTFIASCKTPVVYLEGYNSYFSCDNLTSVLAVPALEELINKIKSALNDTELSDSNRRILNLSLAERKQELAEAKENLSFITEVA